MVTQKLPALPDLSPKPDAPAPDFRCGGCGAPFNRYHDLRSGRGRHLGEHPDHRYAPCGCNISWYGASRIVSLDEEMARA